MRYSKQRNLVYEIVLNSYDHPTAEAIYFRARQIMPNISLGTVYRNLNELANANQIQKISVLADSDRFDRTLNPHLHFLCQSCKDVIDLKTSDFKNFVESLEEKNQVKIVSNQISFIGICPKCQKK